MIDSFFCRNSALLAAITLMPGIAAMASDPGPTQLRIRPGVCEVPGNAAEGRQCFVLEWNAVAGAIYAIETRPRLDDTTPWETYDLVTPASTAGVYMLSTDNGDSSAGIRFIRLRVPSPEIFAVEPARAPAGAEVTLYVTGQCFDPTDTLRIIGPGGPLVLTNPPTIEPNLITVTVTPELPGSYDFELISGATGQSHLRKHIFMTWGQSDTYKPREDWPPGAPAPLMGNRTWGTKGVGQLGDGSEERTVSLDYFGQRTKFTKITGNMDGKDNARLAFGDPEVCDDDDDCDGDGDAAGIDAVADYFGQRSNPFPFTKNRVAGGVDLDGGDDDDDDGGDWNRVHKRPGRTTYSYIALKQGVLRNLGSQSSEGSNRRRRGSTLTGTISMRTSGKVTGNVFVNSGSAMRQGGNVTGTINVNSGSSLRHRGGKVTGTISINKGTDRLATQDIPGKAGDRSYKLADIANSKPTSVGVRGWDPKTKKAIQGKANPRDIMLRASSGELHLEEVDMFVPGRGIDFIWQRTYLSQSGENTPMGHGWVHSYHIYVRPVGADLELHSGDGITHVLYRQANGTYSAPDHFVEGTTMADGRVKVKFPWLGVWEFNPLDGSPSAGRIASSSDAHGNRMTFAYDGLGNLTEITDDLGRLYRVGYTPDAHVASITDFTGRSVTYQYHSGGSRLGGPNDLASVTTPPVIGTPHGNDFPAGKTTYYMYSTGFAEEALNHNLITLVEPSGIATFQFYYRTTITDPRNFNFDTIDNVLRGNTYRTHVRRFPQIPSPSNQFATVKSIIKDPVRNVTEMFFDARHRRVRQLDYTGRAPEADLPTNQTQNRPVNPLRLDDPLYYETIWSWSEANLCTSVTLPRGNRQVMTYEWDFDYNASALKKGDLRVVRELPAGGIGADTDGDGLPDLAALVWRYTHASDLGSPPLGAATGKGLAKSLPSFKDDPYTGGAFVTSATDPRGTVTTFNYDTQGNRIKVQFHWDREGKADVDFAYNAHGQLTTITQPPDGKGYRRRDAITYHDTGPQNGYPESKTWDEGASQAEITERYEWDAVGNLTRFVDPRTNDYIFTYNALDQCVQLESPIFIVGPPTPNDWRIGTQFTYDINNNLTIVNHDNRDENGILDSTQPILRTEFTYDQLNRLSGCWRDKDGRLWLRCTSISHDGNDNVTLFRSGEALNTNDPNNQISYEYDERDQLFRVSEAPGTTVAYIEQCNYTENGQLKAILGSLTDPTPAMGTLRYNGFDQPVGATDAMGNEWTFAFDANDNVVYERLDAEMVDVPGGAGNRRFHEWRWRYDWQDRCTQSREAHFEIETGTPLGKGASIHMFAYAPNGCVLSEKDSNGNTTVFDYDTAWRLASITDARHNVVIVARDQFGNATRLTSIEQTDLGGLEQTFFQTFEYDNLNRRIRATDGVGNTVQYAFDSRDNCLRMIDANGVLTVSEYDGLSRKLKMYVDANADGTLSPGDLHRTFVWNDNDRLLAETDSNGNTTSYAYDSRNRCRLATSPDGQPHTFVWDSRNNLISSTDPNGTVDNYQYNLRNRFLRAEVAVYGGGVSTSTRFESFEYDGAGNLVSARNETSSVQFSYSSRYDLTKGVRDSWPVGRFHDGEGNLLRLTYPGGDVVEYTYDALNRVSTVSAARGGRPPEPVGGFRYAGPDRLVGITRANGTETRLEWNGLADRPNQPGDAGWRQVWLITHAQTGGTIDQRMYAYDHNQNKILRDQTVRFGPATDARRNTMTYDALNRMDGRIDTLEGKVNTYTFDAQGNRVSVTRNVMVEMYDRDPALPEPADFQVDQYTSSPFGQHTYDRNGNLISTQPLVAGEPPIQYEYDYANRLVKLVRTSSDGAVETLASYTYNALGQRITKTTPGGPAPALPVTSYYVYDDDRIIEERDGNTGNLIWSTLWNQPGGVAAEAEVICWRRWDGTLIGYKMEDELNCALAVTDDKGEVSERCDFEDHGAPILLRPDGLPLTGSDGLAVNASQVGNQFLFRGMLWDPETGLYQQGRKGANESAAIGALRSLSTAQNRYDPNLGRCTSRAGAYRFGTAYTAFGDNPWSGGGSGGGVNGAISIDKIRKVTITPTSKFNP